VTRNKYFSTKTAGFTLVELLVAVAILAISMTLVYTIHNSVFSVIENVEQTTAYQGRSGVIFDQLQRDFFGIYKGKSGFLRAEENLIIESEQPFLQFTTSSHLTFNPSPSPVSMTIVSYFLQHSRKNSMYKIYRSEIPFKFGYSEIPGSALKPLLVCENVVTVKLQYKNQYGMFLDGWQPRSSSVENKPADDRFPSLVSVELILADEADEASKKSEKQRFRTLISVPPSQLIQRNRSDES